MAVLGDVINKANIGTAVAYSVVGDNSSACWTFAFGNSIYFRSYCGTASSIWNPHPEVRAEFWRYSISQQSWVHINSTSMGKSTSTIYRVRCNQMPVSGTLRAEYNDNDSFLFAFKSDTTKGERSRCDDRIYMYNLGADTQYEITTLGNLIYGRNEDIAYKYHYTSGGPSALNLNDNWLKTDAMRGELIIPAYAKRMVSVKSAISLT